MDKLFENFGWIIGGMALLVILGAFSYSEIKPKTNADILEACMKRVYVVSQDTAEIEVNMEYCFRLYEQIESDNVL